jgi:hypothetical protein
MAQIKPKPPENPPAARFGELFRGEHREIRDSLLALLTAFDTRNRRRAKTLLGTIGGLCGPHFRYEEEALYPALVEIFGKLYIEHLLVEHDRAIISAFRLMKLADKKPFEAADARLAVRIIRTVLPHVSDCEGLSIMVEVLPEPEVQAILEARERALEDDLDLVEWATEVRKRPFLLTYQRELRATMRQQSDL